MAANSTIGWTTHTMNFWWGCHKVARECRHCYISSIMRHAGREPFQGLTRTTASWSNPPRWDRQARQDGVRRRVFTCSMSDFFHPGADAWRAAAWDVIRACTNLDWLILTKRPQLAAARLPPDWGAGWPHVWLGVSCGCRDSLGMLPHLQDLPAAVKFVSAEPLLERMDFRPYLGWLDWLITGCERAASGKRQVMNLDWVRDIDRQCQEAGVAHWFKQAYATRDGREWGVPCERPLLDGRIVQQHPAGRRPRSAPRVCGTSPPSGPGEG
jgi:protein gp37